MYLCPFHLFLAFESKACLNPKTGVPPNGMTDFGAKHNAAIER